MRSVSDPEADDSGRAPPYTRLQRPSAASARRSRRIASSEIWNSSANSEAITESPASSLSAITSLLDVGSGESCINKKYHEQTCISSAWLCTIGKKAHRISSANLQTSQRGQFVFNVRFQGRLAICSLPHTAWAGSAAGDLSLICEGSKWSTRRSFPRLSNADYQPNAWICSSVRVVSRARSTDWHPDQ